MESPSTWPGSTGFFVLTHVSVLFFPKWDCHNLANWHQPAASTEWSATLIWRQAPHVYSTAYVFGVIGKTVAKYDRFTHPQRRCSNLPSAVGRTGVPIGSWWIRVGMLSTKKEASRFGSISPYSDRSWHCQSRSLLSQRVQFRPVTRAA